ncbi:MAG: FAD-dependent oxidoreductase, partial [Armatimonadetes bacterium]|nr:FAD-dependent oxidoreductase [Armatimonadota bacterium]
MSWCSGTDVVVVGGGLAGCDAAWSAAREGARVALYEMRPARRT